MDNKTKTALVLGGGGARGAYEIGVWQALREMDMKIHIVSGSSVGAINGAMVAQGTFETAVNLWKEIKTEMVLDPTIPKRNPSPLNLLLNQYIDEDKIRKSSIEFGLVTLELPSIISRSFFLEDIPYGKLVDYIIASSSLFPAFRAADINNTKYVDGGYFDNLPVNSALLKGATNVIAVDLETAGIVQKEPLKKAENLTLISCKWDLGSIMTFDSKSSIRNLRLGYLDALKAFGFFDGYYYAFPKGEMNKRSLKQAEISARIFELNPEILFTKGSLQKELKSKILSYRNQAKNELQRFQHQTKSRKLDRALLHDLLKKINQKSITIIIADHLKANPDAPDSFLAKPVSILFKEESSAANYLVKERII
jgi:NTE family protein